MTKAVIVMKELKKSLVLFDKWLPQQNVQLFSSKLINIFFFKVQMGHVVDESLNPEWDTMIEFFTHDYTQVKILYIRQSQILLSF